MNRRLLGITGLLVIIGVLLLSLLACGVQRSESVKPIEISRAIAAGDLAGLPGIIMSQQNVGLWINGLGKANATPDIVLISLGVEAQEKTVAQAQKAASDAMNKIMSVLKGSGIADKDIQTRQFNIQQVTRWDDKQSTEIVLGYRITNSVVAKIRNVDKAGSIIDSVASAAGDLARINSISFTVDDPTPYYKIAREKAVQEAMEKARQIAQASGIKIGKAIYVNEGSTYSSPVRDNYMLKSAEMMPAAPTPISPGELEFQVNVSMVYEIN